VTDNQNAILEFAAKLNEFVKVLSEQ